MAEKKYIINEDMVKAISKALQGYIEHIDEDCSRSGCMCDLRGEVCSQNISDVLHDFDSGLVLVPSLKKIKEITIGR